MTVEARQPGFQAAGSPSCMKRLAQQNCSADLLKPELEGELECSNYDSVTVT